MGDGANDDEALWSVWRQDDHGHRFEVAHGLSAADAERELERFEAAGHKQTYWIAPTGPRDERR